MAENSSTISAPDLSTAFEETKGCPVVCWGAWSEAGGADVAGCPLTIRNFKNQKKLNQCHRVNLIYNSIKTKD